MMEVIALAVVFIMGAALGGALQGRGDTMLNAYKARTAVMEKKEHPRDHARVDSD